MANTLTVLIPKLLSGGLMALRQNCLTLRLVRTYGTVTPQNPGNAITIPVPASQAAASVSPSNTPPSNIDHTPTSKTITLDKWYKTDFHLSDQDVTNIAAQASFIPMQASEAVKVLANQIDSDLLALYKEVYYHAGTAATTPFASDATAWTTGARKKLNVGLAPQSDRHVVLNEDAEANAINLEEFQSAAWAGSSQGIVEGEIGRKLGASWWLNQNIPSHTKGTLAPGTQLQSNAEIAVGAVTAVLKDSGGSMSGTMAAGDLFSFAGSTDQFTCAALATAGSNVITVTWTPACTATIAASTNCTHVAGHKANLAFHRDWAGVAFAPLGDADFGLANLSYIQDPISGAVLRLEVTREYKQTTFRYDVLYGMSVIRPSFAARILG